MSNLIQRPQLKEKYDNYINGTWTPPSTGQYFEVVSPIDGKLLAKAASELEHQPLETLDVVGMALSDESDPASLAERRAKMVAGLLINRYQVDPKKLRVSSNIGDRSIVILTMRRGD